MNKDSPLTDAVIPAAGIGRRMGSDIPKQYLKIGGATMLERTVSVFVRNPRIRRVIVALAPGDPYFAKLPLASDPRISVCEGGAERADTVLRALALAQGPYALVHDAARPLLCDEDLNALLDAGLSCDDGALLAVPMADTVKRGEGGRCQGTVPRAGLWRALTPQMAPLKTLIEALKAAGSAVTDESSALERLGLHPLLVECRHPNFKVTAPADLVLARSLICAGEKQCSE
ncbi:MAG: 2-C-methyl-D-erythritol 4-phosphate cytidylyltransferase [Succinivibrio sp.]|nr:2-C-methyl-D-erythritol 4-phosphate cytidylyltransferase [Succinivibrio sp.]